MISQELQTALTTVQKKYPDIVFEEHLMKIFIGKITELKENMPFGEAMRYSLNHVNIWDKKVRSAYSSLAGTYFGRRGKMQRRHGSIKQKKKVSTPRNIVDKNGQYELDI